MSYIENTDSELTAVKTVSLTLLLSERQKLHTILAFLSALGLMVTELMIIKHLFYFQAVELWLQKV